MKIIVIVDMQYDFIDGSLGSAEAQAIVPIMIARLKEYEGEQPLVIFTKDTHEKNYLETQEGKKLPVPHCIKGTKGWEIADGLYVEGSKIIDKPNFGWQGWESENLESVELVGLCTDICVVSNALIIKALFPDIEIKVAENCCAGVTPESHAAAITTMKMCQIEIV